MRMHGERMGCVVFEYHPNGVTYLGAQHGTQHAAMLPLWSRGFELGERIVCVFAVDRLAIDAPDAMRPGLGEEPGVSRKGHAHHPVDTQWSVIPLHFVAGDVVSVHRACEACLYQGKDDYEQRRNSLRQTNLRTGDSL